MTAIFLTYDTYGSTPFVVRTNCLQQKTATIFRLHEQTWGGRRLDWGGTSSYTVVDVLATGNSQAKVDRMVGTARQWLASAAHALAHMMHSQMRQEQIYAGKAEQHHVR